MVKNIHDMDFEEEREFITLSQNQYNYLLKALQTQFQFAGEFVLNEENENNARNFALSNMETLKKYIDVLKYGASETVFGRIEVAFYKDFGNDLFLFLLANITGEFSIV